MLSRNPLFPNKVTRYELTPEKVDCVVFCSKDYHPILPRLQEITSRFNTYFHYTITGEDKKALAQGLGSIARTYGIYLQTCGTDQDYSSYGIHPFGCMTLDILGKANGISFKSRKHKGLRQGCHCIESRDIGAYDTCLNGCKYCYANTRPQKARENYQFHDPDSPLLLGHLKETDVLTQRAQKPFLRG